MGNHSLIDQSEIKEGAAIWNVIGAAMIICVGAFLGLAVIARPPDSSQTVNAVRTPSLLAQLFASPTATSTSTPVPTPTSTPSPTPNATATQQVLDATSTAVAVDATAVQAAGWKSIFSETFEKNNGAWVIGPSDDEYAKMDFAVQHGVYRWDATAHKGFVQRVSINTQSLGDFFLSAGAAQVSGTDQAAMGLVFRQDTNGNYYYFAMNNNTQEYSLQKWVDGQWTTIIEYTYTSVIDKGKPNRMGVLAEGSQFYLFINNQYLAQASDTSIPKGITGLAIELAQADLQASFEFDNILIRAPKGP